MVDSNSKGLNTESLHGLAADELMQLLERAKRDGLKREKGEESQPITAVDRTEALPLSFAQQRLWFLDQFEKSEENKEQAYLINSGIKLTGVLHTAILKAALDRIVYRHEALRTTFKLSEGVPLQEIAPPEAGFFLLEHNMISSPQSEIERLIAKEASTPFDLAIGPLIRGRLVRISETEHILLVNMHHIVSDGWSMGVFINELSTLYQAFCEGKVDPLPPLTIQYADYAAWQRNFLKGDRLQKQLAYWKEHLKGAPELLELPKDRPRPAIQNYAGQSISSVIDAELTKALKDLSQRQGVTLYMTLLTGWVVLLSRLSGQRDIVIGTGAANRMRSEIEPLIGFFVNVLALRIDLNSRPTVVELLKKIKQLTLSAQSNQDLPFEQIVEAVNPIRSPSHSPLFQIMFAWQNTPTGKLRLGDLKLEGISIPAVTSRFDLSLSIQDGGEVLIASVEYATSLFEQSTIEGYLANYRTVLWAMVDGESQRVDQLQILSQNERQQILYDWNATQTEYPRDKCLHQLFETQVEKSPDAEAVAYEGGKLSYRELNERSNQLARYLLKRDVESGSIVSIMMNRSPEMVISILGTLKAGGAYLPIDPHNPENRLHMLLDDSQTKLLLTEEEFIKDIPFTRLQNLHDINKHTIITKTREPIANIDALPFPDRNLVDYPKYHKYIGEGCVTNAISIMASRGCPFKCLYCHRIWPKKQVVRSAENIFQEVLFHYQRGYRTFNILDDIFNLDRKNSEAFFKLIVKNKLKIRLLFPNGLRGDILTPDYIDLMAEAGVMQMALALETASDRLQKLLKKHLKIEKLRENLHYISKNHPGIIVDLFTMFGFPSETEEEAMMTLDFIKSIKWLHFPLLSALKIFPGSEMAHVAMQHGISEEAIQRSSEQAFHDLGETLPFSTSFGHEYQTDYLSNYFLNKERLEHVIPFQKRVLTFDEITTKYNSYLPGGLSKYPEVAALIGDKGFFSDNTAIAEVSQDSSSVISLKKETVDKPLFKKSGLRVLLLDLSQYFSNKTVMLDDMVEAPLGLMYLLTYLNQQFGNKVHGKIAKSMIDFDNYDQLHSLLGDFDPQVIGIRTLSLYKGFFHQTVSLIKQWFPNVPIITGGPYASSESDTILSDRNIDVVVQGEGEITLAELIGEMIEAGGTLPADEVLHSIAGIKFIPRQREKENEARSGTREILCLDNIAAEIALEDPKNLAKMNDAENMAYVMYTSGSTGEPKGVMAPQNGVKRLVINNRYAAFNADDRVAFVSNPAFDAATMEVWAPLLNGGSVVVIDKEALLDPSRFATILTEQRITVLFITTALFNQYAMTIPQALSRLRYLLCGGERCDPQSFAHLLGQGGPQHLIHCYGPTETTTYASTAEISEVLPEATTLPIGRPIGNTRIYILDDNHQPVPIGVSGEIYIGGEGVAQAYLNRAELTAERFLSDPFVKATKQEPVPRMYKTGDLGRFLRDGNIEYLGRNDFQIKIRGFRIELSEIETRLVEIDGIKEAVVLAIAGPHGDKRLVAYYTGREELSVESMRCQLENELPEYMVPGAFVQLSSLPLNPNGKIDSKALPTPEDNAFNARAYEAPEGEVEQKLAALWSELLQIEKIGRYDHFFELGGHSLMAVTLMSRMNELGLATNVRVLFATPVLCELAAVVGGDAQPTSIKVPPNLIPAECDHITPEMLPLVDLKQADIDCIVQTVPQGVTGIQDIYPLSPLQEGLLFHHLMVQKGDTYLVPMIMAFDTHKRLKEFIDAFQRVIQRHDILRTAILWEELPEPVQVVWKKASLPIENVMLNGENIADELLNHMDPRRYRLDVGKAPMIRAHIAKDEKENRWLLGLLTHHMAIDHTSMELIIKEIVAYLEGDLQNLPKPTPYRGFVAQAHLGVSRKEHEAFFRKMLGTVDEPTAPLGLLDVQQDGSGISAASLQLDGDLCLRLRTRARKIGVGLAGICHLAWAQVLSRLSGCEDVVFGTVLFGRMQGVQGADQTMGLFINTLPVRIAVGDEPVEQAVRTTHALLAQLLHHEHASLSLAQRCSAVKPPTPLFSALLNYRHSQSADTSESDEPVEEGVKMIHSEERTNYPLLLNVDDFGQDLGITIQVQEPIDPMLLCGYVRTALVNLVDALEKTPQTSVRSIDVMSVAERKQVLYDWNATEAQVPKDQCIHQLFEVQVNKTPDAVAVVYEEQRLTFKELNQQANQLAHHLISLGVVPDTKVAIAVERSLEMVVGLLAILKAGGAYVPLDPAYPDDRLSFMLKDSSPLALLTQSSLRDRWKNLLGQIALIEIDSRTKDWQKQSTANLNPGQLGLTPQHLAYVIYTSGSTGLPKGVLVEHANVARLFSATDAWFQFGPDDVWTQFHSYAFDFSVWEIWGALLYGGRLVVVPQHIARSPDEFYQLLCRQGVTVLNQTPSAFRQLISAQADNKSADDHRLRLVIFGGEALDVSSLEPWYERNDVQRTQLVNMYGITETTVHVTYRPIAPSDTKHRGASPIGSRIPDLVTYILDPNQQPAPIGVVGELFVGGAGVARGYLNRPELTQERFLPDPFRKATEQEPTPRIYKTGDLGRWLPDGTIEYLGRNDFQVKVRGFRIELSEIEAKLSAIPGIDEAIAIAREDNPGEKRLVAYYRAESELTADMFRAELSSDLPDYMVPSTYVKLEAFPLTANGKLDRKALPAPEGSRPELEEAYVAPRTETEETLAGIWNDVLALERVGIYDNFFDLGGDSILSIKVMARAKECGLNFTLQEFYRCETIFNLAKLIGTAERRSLSAPKTTAFSLVEERDRLKLPSDAQDAYPLGELQAGMLFHSQLNPETAVYHDIFSCHFRTPLDINALRKACRQMFDRHPVLRTSFELAEFSEPLQIVHQAVEIPIQVADISHLSPSEQETALAAWIEAEKENPFDWKKAPLLRLQIHKRTSETFNLTVSFHHAILDGWSLSLLWTELFQRYASQLGNEAPSFGPLPAIAFRDFVALERLSIDSKECREYWIHRLNDVSIVKLPRWKTASDLVEFAEAAREAVVLSQKKSESLKKFAKKAGVPLKSVLLAAHLRVMSLLSGQSDVLTGLVTNGRPEESDGERLLGLFLNTVPFRLCTEGRTWIDLVQETFKAEKELLPFRRYPLAKIQRTFGQQPLFETAFNYVHFHALQEAAKLENMEILGSSAFEQTNYTMSTSFNQDPLTAQLSLLIDYDTSQLCVEQIRAISGYYVRTLAAMVNDPFERQDLCSLLDSREKQKILFYWNDTIAVYPKDKCVHRLFEMQVEKTPDAVAVVYENEQLTYAQLNRQANQLATHLIAMGVQPDTTVAICMERSREMVVGLLAVLKAGGAYVPLDPAYPDQRIEFMLKDSSPVVLLTQIALKERWADLSQKVPIIELDAETKAWGNLSTANPILEELGLNSQHLAYVIYTSGSTGEPKGVMVEHRNLSNLIHWHCKTFSLKENDSSSCLAGFGFDASTWELWPPLCVGAKLLLAPASAAHDPVALLTWWQDQPLDVSFLPTPIAEYAFTADMGNSKLRYLLTGGDRLHQLPESSSFDLINNYGPTEATVVATSAGLEQSHGVLHIGRPITNTSVFILDQNQQPVPIGVVGELYIGGEGVARGYLNRPELTAEKFLPDPFVKAKPEEPSPRIYKTGDLGRFLPDGNIEYLGRNDFQVKIRGFRIELGEIEARLATMDGILEAVVHADKEASGDQRLIAYYTASEELSAESLRTHLSSQLPEYMVPVAFVSLEALPLTPNGKLDRKALPVPDGNAFAIRAYVPPQGDVEKRLAKLWAEALRIEKIGRWDHFFELGGHSLMAVTLISRMHNEGLHTDIRTLFNTPILADLSEAISTEAKQAPIQVPPNLIYADCESITPELLPLVDLTQAQIERIVQTVPDGVANIQDIYPLSPLQEGLLFHHLMTTEGDTYLLSSVTAFDTKESLEGFIDAINRVIERHDILRTAVLWEELPEPVQVVWRRAPLPVEEVMLSEDNAAEELYNRIDSRRFRIDVRTAPMMRVSIAEDKKEGRWLFGLSAHHLAADHTSLDLIGKEVQAHLMGDQHLLPVPVPYRNFVTQARCGVSRQEHEDFFRQMLGTVEEPTAPFGLMNEKGDVLDIAEATLPMDSAQNDRLRECARNNGVSVASLCHLAWAQVLSRLTGRQEVVFGTVLFGRMQGIEGIDRVMGMFINTLPLCIVVGDEPVGQAVRSTHTRLARLMHHEHASLALAQRCSAVPAGTPLFTTLLNYRYLQSQGGNDKDVDSPAWGGMQGLYGVERSNYPLSLDVNDLGIGFSFTVQAQAPIDPMHVGGYITTALEHLMDALEKTPQTAIRSIDVMGQAEQKQVLFDWNNTETDYPKDKCIHQLFETQVEKTPDALAVVYEDEQLSYAQLNRQANQLAHHLIAKGIKPDDLVAVCVQRSLDMVVGLLAVLKAGGAYVPLDPVYPDQRLKFMLKDSEPVALLTSGSLKERWADLPEHLEVIELDTKSKAWGQLSATNPNLSERGLTSQHLAYVIYTSGSTGTPKGVMVEHCNMINQMICLRDRLNLGPDDRFLQFASISFDASAEEVFTTLASGAALVLRTDAWLAGVSDFWDLCQHHGVSVVDLPTQFWSQLIKDPTPIAESVKMMIPGGELMSEQALQTWFERSDHRPRLLNSYGPTETTVNATLHAPRDAGDWRAIGRPIANTRIYILDQYARPVPVGATGEIYIGGAGVARGYLNRPELTEERFLPDLFVNETPQEPNPRIYKTGDLGRFLPDGTIEYLGRNDFQVKIRGFRIELGEIEARLAEMEGVKEAVVQAREDVQGEKRLIAYYICSEEMSADSLRTYLSSTLPAYMVPVAFVRLEALPLTPSGKLDRKALPAPENDAFSIRRYEAPVGEVEQTLAAIWAELLHIEKIGRHDHFFELGGHSLLAVTLISRLRGQGLHAEVRALFATPILCELAAAIRAEPQVAPINVPPNLIPAGCAHITPELLPLVDLTQADIEQIAKGVPGGATNIQDIYPLAPLQEGILFHHLLAQQGDVFLTPSIMAFDTKERLENFLDAFQRVINRHDILRTAVQWEGLPEPVQVVWRKAALPVEEVTFSGENAAEELFSLIDPRHHTMDVQQAPLLRAMIGEDKTQERWLLGLSNHHLSADHTSLELMVKEVQAYLLGEHQQLPEPLAYRDFIAQARYEVSNQEHEAFFKQMLAEVDEPTAPFGLMDVQCDGSSLTEATMPLDAQLCGRLRQSAREMGVSVASICHLAWARVLSFLTGRQDVVFGTVLFGRMQGGQGADQVMGMFINTLPVRIVAGDEPVEKAVGSTHTLLAQLLHHEHASLSLAQRCSEVPPPTPLFTALLNYRYTQGGNTSHAEETAWEGMQVLYGEDLNNYPFTLHVDDFGEDFRLTAQVKEPIDPMLVCEYMNTALVHLMEALEVKPQASVRSIEVMGTAERHQILYDWNATREEYPEDKCMHELFEAQVGKTPGAVAVVCEDNRLTYHELNQQANRLARHLISLGVVPDTLVAIGVERNLEMVVGLLAVLKAGGAYVALDPTYPAERLAFMLEDCAPLALLTQRSLKESWPVLSEQVEVIELDAKVEDWCNRSVSNLNPSRLKLTSNHLAYVIYTSGSTGKPKGVAIEHRNAVNFISWAQREFKDEDYSQSLFATSINFDLAVYECFVPLAMGGTVNLVDTPLSLIEQSPEVTLINTVPSAMTQLVEADRVPDTVRVVNLAGEVLKRGLVTRIFEKTAVQTVCNLYGPSETTTYSTWIAMSREQGFAAHIGRPISNTRIYILDGNHQPVPIGVTGELYIGGAGVARGYMNRPELTNERFLRDPFVKTTKREPNPRMYKTGDLGRYLPDGTIEYLGRNDFQVKIRGYRIELGEIEARMAEIKGVAEVVVLSSEETSGDKRLVAYYTGSEELSAELLRTHLSSTLPGHMVPAAFVRLEALPLTPNGKLDRKVLPTPQGDAFSTCVYEAPQGELEQTLAAIWTELLNISQIGRHDSFFDLGGHSLLAIQTVSMLKQAGIDAQVATVFTYPTIERLATYLEEENAMMMHGVIPLRRTGAGTPLFLVHDVSGDVLYAAQLERYIDDDIPVYGLVDTRLGEKAFRTMHARATRLVRIIRAVQPLGPYRIAGYSFGGNLAYEIATQLLGEDETVEFLGLIDSFNFADTAMKAQLPLDDNTLLLNFVLQMAGESALSFKEQLETTAKTSDLRTLVKTCRENQLLSQTLSMEVIENYLARMKASVSALSDYHPLSVPISIHLFSASEERKEAPLCKDIYLGWEQVLQKSQIHMVTLPGQHVSIMSPPQIDGLGKALTDAIRQAGGVKKAVPMQNGEQLFSLQTGGRLIPPVFCVPGAGANITDFNDLIDALGNQWSIYGLQPRGFFGGHVPHSTVHAATKAYLNAIAETHPVGPLHLLGHSFGGWVVFEMALKLQAAGRKVDSVSLIDTEAPEADGILALEYNRTEVFMELVNLSEQRVERSLNLESYDFDGLDYPAQLKLLHKHLVAVEMVPYQSKPDILSGMLRTFATNLRTSYCPSDIYTGAVNLVMVRDAKDDEETCQSKQMQLAADWKRFAPELVTWRGPGNHMTLLNPPFVDMLADWLRVNLCS